MIGLFCFAMAVLASPFKSKLRLEAENAVLRHQSHGRAGLTNHDRWFFIQLYRWFPSILQILTIILRGVLIKRWGYHQTHGLCDRLGRQEFGNR
jgi:hypothetical protein